MELLTYWPYIVVSILALASVAVVVTLTALSRAQIVAQIKRIPFASIGQSLVTWSWTKKLLYWVIISGGTMAELAFLAGSIWMSLNATVHPFILKFLSEDLTHSISFLATTAYVALPELIVSLAVIVTIGHIKMFVYNKKNWIELIWAILYGLPALFFAGLSAYTIGESVANVDFTMPEPLIITRALAGFLFAFTSLLYWKLGEPQEADRLKKKDEERAVLQQEKDGFIAGLQKDFAEKNLEWEKEKARLHKIIEQQKADLADYKDANKRLFEAVKQSDDAALEVYGDECLEWLKSGVKSADVDTISRYTGLSKTKIGNALKSKDLQSTPNNESLITLRSLIPWLKKVAKTAGKTDVNLPALHVVGR